MLLCQVVFISKAFVIIIMYFCFSNKPMSFKNYPNCNSKRGNSNELVSYELCQKLEEFLPDDFIEESYCVKYLTDFNISLERSNLLSTCNSFLLNRLYVNKRIDKKKALLDSWM